MHDRERQKAVYQRLLPKFWCFQAAFAYESRSERSDLDPGLMSGRVTRRTSVLSDTTPHGERSQQRLRPASAPPAQLRARLRRSEVVGRVGLEPKTQGL